MSDPTDQGGQAGQGSQAGPGSQGGQAGQGGAAGDFRGSRVEKRQDETVMINADNLSDLVASAKGGTPVEPTSGSSGSSGASASNETSKGLPDDELADSQLGRILVIAGIIVVLLAAIIIVYVNVIQK